MSDALDAVDELVHEPSQTGGQGVDLTLGRVARTTGFGQIDFGGDEYAAPDAVPVDPERRDPSDDYGWWELDEGMYLVEYNETIADGDHPLLLQPHPRLLALGASHPTVRVTDLERIPLAAPDGGLALKENARISTLLDPAP